MKTSSMKASSTKAKGRRRKVLATKKVAKARQTIYESNTTNSPLLRLPPEIRNRIFRYVLGGNTIHVFSDFRRKRASFATSICRAQSCDRTDTTTLKEQNEGKISTIYLYPDYQVRHNSYNVHVHRTRPPFERLSVAVLQVSRQVHQEAALFPFCKNRFTFVTTHLVLSSFLKQIVPSQAHSIRDITICCPGKANNKVETQLRTKLTGLEKLTCFVELTRGRMFGDERHTREGFRSYLNGLLQFRCTPANDNVIAGSHIGMGELSVLKEFNVWLSEMESEIGVTVQQYDERVKNEKEEANSEAAASKAVDAERRRQTKAGRSLRTLKGC